MSSSKAQRAVAWTTSVAVLTLVVVAASLLPEPRPAAAELKPYESCVPLLAHYRAELRRTATPWSVGHGGHGIAKDGVALAAGAPGAAEQRSTDTAVGTGATGTNTQEAGVDEPDVTKIAGGVVYTYSAGSLRLLRAGDRPQLLSTTVVSRDRHPGELLVDGDRVLVLVSSWRPGKGATPDPGGPGAPGTPRIMIAPAHSGEAVTTVVLFDASDPAGPRRLEEYEIEGQYLSARLTAGRVRLVTTSAPAIEGVQPQAPHGKAQQDAALAENRRRADLAKTEDVLPRAVRRDGAGKVVSDRPALGCTDVSRPSEPRGASTIVVSTFVPSRGLAPTGTTGVTAEGDLVYATADRLYVATSRWTSVEFGQTAAPSATENVTTGVHAFATGELDRVAYVGSGSVPGWVLGRWAFSYHERHLRVATTRQPPWQGTDPTIATSSSLAVLAEDGDRLVEVGRVDGLGPGERIHAVRYFGDIATVVTFRQTDPLYVLDLANPRAPRVRGELKIPGFSTYLHPVGGDRLLGLGHDATDTGQVTGMQLSLFDLSDLSKPRQVHRLSLGPGWSTALQESRAFNYDPARRLAILPFHGYDGGQPALLGITIGPDGTLREAGRVRAASGVERALYDADHVYGAGPSGVVAASAGTLTRTGEVSFG